VKIKKGTVFSKKIISILLILSWGYAQYSVMNRFYAVFLTVFFFFQLFFRQRSFLLLAVSILSITLFQTSTINTIEVLKEKNLGAVGNPKVLLRNVFSPDTGEEVLPDNVRKMLFLLRYHEISDYRLSSALAEDALIMQRITEAAWPIKREDSSLFVFKLVEEKNQNSDCVSINQREGIELVYCP
jgi:hypothetical protein